MQLINCIIEAFEFTQDALQLNEEAVLSINGIFSQVEYLFTPIIYAISQLFLLFYKFSHFLEDILINLSSNPTFIVNLSYLIDSFLYLFLSIFKVLPFACSFILKTCHYSQKYLKSFLYLTQNSGFQKLLNFIQLVSSLLSQIQQSLETTFQLKSHIYQFIIALFSLWYFIFIAFLMEFSSQ